MSVLIIEDEAAVAKALQKLLSLRYKNNISIADSVKSAEAALKSQQFSLLIVDYNLPDGTGYGLLCELTKELSWLIDCPLMFISGVSYVDLTQEFRQSVRLFSNLHVRNKPILAEDLYQIADLSLELKA